ncbi:carboxymuconolactone decarboxylase family protein [Natronococcus sp.]|uniref:carboxymuconolactone decarboxylase family protein n=1 Tax=Natronococcus sp. TaxID=35747 RepID=UPI003A4DCAF8
MALLEYIPPDVEDKQIQELLEADADVYGRPSLFARIVAHNPTVLEARQEYVGSLTESGALDATESELAYVTVAAENECSYCVASHTERLVEHVGMSRDMVEMIVTDEVTETEFSDRERAIISFARAAASDPKRVSDSDIEVLRDAEFDTEDIVELAVIVGTAVSANVIADTLNILPQDQSTLDEYES